MTCGDRADQAATIVKLIPWIDRERAIRRRIPVMFCRCAWWACTKQFAVQIGAGTVTARTGKAKPRVGHRAKRFMAGGIAALLHKMPPSQASPQPGTRPRQDLASAALTRITSWPPGRGAIVASNGLVQAIGPRRGIDRRASGGMSLAVLAAAGLRLEPGKTLILNVGAWGARTGCRSSAARLKARGAFRRAGQLPQAAATCGIGHARQGPHRPSRSGIGRRDGDAPTFRTNDG